MTDRTIVRLDERRPRARGIECELASHVEMANAFQRNPSDLLERLIRTVSRLPGFAMARSDNELHIFPPQQEGFRVSVHRNDVTTTVVLGPWTCALFNDDDVVYLVRSALKGDVRMFIDDADGPCRRVCVEVRNRAGAWIEIAHDKVAANHLVA